MENAAHTFEVYFPHIPGGEGENFSDSLKLSCIQLTSNSDGDTALEWDDHVSAISIVQGLAGGGERNWEITTSGSLIKIHGK